MAEEKDINIKILIDAANAAKTVGETRKALRDLLVAAQQVEEGSEAFNNINKSAGELKDRIGDLQANVKFFADDLRGLTAANEIAQGIAASFGLVTASFEALGISTDSAEQATKKLITVQTILNSLQTIGALVQKESAANILLTNAARAIGINLVIAEESATGKLTAAQRILNIVTKASPMGILIGLATGLVAAYTLLTGKTEEQTKADKKAAEEKKQLAETQKEYSEYIGKEASSYALLIAELQQTNPLSKERKDLIDKINGTYGTTLKNISDETLFQNQLNKSLDEYVDFLQLKFKAQQNEKAVDKQLQYRQSLIDELNKAEQDLQKSIKARQNAGYKDTGRDLRIALELQYEVIDELKGNVDAAEKGLKYILKQSLDTNKQVAETGLKTADEVVKTGGKKITDTSKELEKENARIIDALIQKQVQALEDLKQISIEINSENVKPKIIENLNELDKKLDDIKGKTGDVIPNIKAFSDAFVLGTEESIGVLDEFGVKFDDARKKLSVGFFGQRNDFVKVIQDIRKEFENAEPAQLAYINTITESYLKVKDIITPFKLENITIGIDEDGVKKQLKGSEEILKAYFENIKNKLQFKGLELFGVKDVTETLSQIESSTVSVADKVATLNSIQITGAEKLKKLTSELVSEQNELATLQTKGGEGNDVLIEYSEGRIAQINKEIKTIEDGIKTIETTVKTKDFNVFRELFPAKNYGDIRDNLKEIRKELIETATKDYLSKNPLIKSAEDIEKVRKNYGEYLDEFEQTVETTTKNENAVRSYTFEIQELGKKFGDTTKDVDLFFKALEKDIPTLTIEEFDFSKLKKGGEEVLEENTKIINEFLIKNGVSAELLAKLSLDEIKKLNKLFLKETIKLDEEGLKGRKDAILSFYSSLASSIQSIMNNISDNITDSNVSAIENAKEEALKAFDEETQAYEDMMSDMSNADKAKVDKDRARAREREIIEKQYQDAIREAQYEGEVRKWEYSLAEAGIQATLSVLKASPNPFGMAAAAILGTLSIAAIASNPPQKLATGGMVNGPGSGTSDSVPTMLSNGEFVINAKATAQNLPLLQQINGMNTPSPMLKKPMKLASGGLVNQSNVDMSRLENILMQMVDRPIKTYVVSSDMTNSQNKDNRIKQRTTF